MPPPRRREGRFPSDPPAGGERRRSAAGNGLRRPRRRPGRAGRTPARSHVTAGSAGLAPGVGRGTAEAARRAARPGRHRGPGRSAPARPRRSGGRAGSPPRPGAAAPHGLSLAPLPRATPPPPPPKRGPLTILLPAPEETAPCEAGRGGGGFRRYGNERTRKATRGSGCDGRRRGARPVPWAGRRLRRRGSPPLLPRRQRGGTPPAPPSLRSQPAPQAVCWRPQAGGRGGGAAEVHSARPPSPVTHGLRVESRCLSACYLPALRQNSKDGLLSRWSRYSKEGRFRVTASAIQKYTQNRDSVTRAGPLLL